MAGRQAKPEIVTFKVEKALADFLDKLPNKSDYIRRAIIAQIAIGCPLCQGTGAVARGIHDHYGPIVAEHSQAPCEICGAQTPFPSDLDGLEGDELKRIEQFFDGGPIYCTKCYQAAPPCDECGWRLRSEELAQHIRQAHLNSSQ